MPVQVEAHGVSVGEAEYPGDVVRVDQIIEKYATGHRTSLHLLADKEYTCDLSVRRIL
jgi:excisionase family DNA binding protein